MSARRLTPTLVLVAALLCWPACQRSAAEATFSPFALATGDPAHGLQAEYAYEPAVAADGEYVAFTGVVASKPGVYRKDLATGELATVALGTGTGAPSISADGRYVSFTTSDDPLTGGEPTPPGCTQVYRRDMDAGATEPAAYAVASALNGPGDEPLTYAGSGKENCPGGGSASAGRVALSADGSEVAFTVIGQSNLTAEPTEPPGATPTPPEQVAVRNFGTDSTTLVSVTQSSLGRAPQPVPAGATLSGSPSLEGVLRKEGGEIELGQAASTAAISADGSTVAWMGVNIAAQAPVGNLPHIGEYVDSYAEPLWRRIAEGPAAPTRRVLAGDDASAPSCPPSCAGGLALEWGEEFVDTTNYKGAGPAYGSYISDAESGFTSVYDVTPQLSADGMQVAILSTQPDYGHLPNIAGQKNLKKPPTANAFVVDMTPGLTREQAITRLTEWASPDFSNPELDGGIGQIALSADGTRVAFTTERVAFPLAPPVLVTPPVNQAETPQLYEANLQAGTLALVSQGYNGEPANHEGGGIKEAALSGDGKVLALASGSSNLAFGAVNEGSDVFVTDEIDSPAVAGVQSVTPLPPGPAGEADWSISATARGSDGVLLIDVSVPGAGRLTASANASVPSTVAVSSRLGKGATRPRVRRTSPVRSARASAGPRTVTVIATRQVAHAASTAVGGGLVQLRLTPSSRYSSLVYDKGGLYATIVVTFLAPGHPGLAQTLQASFPRPPSTHGATARRRRKPHSSSTHGRTR
jgi:hypothetical protein